MAPFKLSINIGTHFVPTKFGVGKQINWKSWEISRNWKSKNFWDKLGFGLGNDWKPKIGIGIGLGNLMENVNHWYWNSNGIPTFSWNRSFPNDLEFQWNSKILEVDTPVVNSLKLNWVNSHQWRRRISESKPNDASLGCNFMALVHYIDFRNFS